MIFDIFIINVKQLFVKKFRVKTATEPTKYAYSGYDIGLYFAQLFAAYGKLPEAEKWPKISGLNKGFYFDAKGGSGAKNNFIYQLHIKDFELLETKQ